MLLRLIVAAGLILAGLPAANASDPLLMGVGAPVAAAAYTGPGDIVASATAWYGLRAYNAAVAATGTQKAVNIRRASDNTTADEVILTTGAFDIASANTFAGQDAACTGSMVGTTTLKISPGSSGTLRGNNPLPAVGATNPFYITAIGTCATPPGTCTVNVAQTFVAEAVTAQVALFVTKWYDQTLRHACDGSTTCDISQPTTTKQPHLLPSCINSLPCVAFNTTGVGNLGSDNLFTPDAAAIVSFSAVGNSISGGKAFDWICDAGCNNNFFHPSSNNVWILQILAVTIVSATASEQSWHAGNVASQTGANASVINLDGTETTGTGTPDVTDDTIGMGWAAAMVAYETEAGVWDKVLFSSGNRTGLCRNQQAYYGSGNFGAVC